LASFENGQRPFKASQDPTSEARQNPMLTRKNDNQKSTYDYF